MPTPADELRTAAQKIRELARAIEAPDLPDQSWHVEECANEERGDCPCIVAQGRYSYHDEPQKPLFYVADAETPECAAYIAAMDPTVGLALADWLDCEARTWDSPADDEPVTERDEHSLAVARTINGTES